MLYGDQNIQLGRKVGSPVRMRGIVSQEIGHDQAASLYLEMPKAYTGYTVATNHH